MANYTIPDYEALLPGEPWTSAKAISAFENLEAFAEQATDAPKMAMKSVTANVTGGATMTIASLSDYSGVYIQGRAVGASGGSTISLTLTLSTDSGSTYATPQNIISTTSDVDVTFWIMVNFINGDWRASFASEPAGVASGNFTSVANNVTNVRLAGISVITAFIVPNGGDAAS